MMEPVPLGKILWTAVKLLALFHLGFFFGLACATSKYRGVRIRARKLENWKKATLTLCPKLKDGEDAEKEGGYLPVDIKLKTSEPSHSDKTDEAPGSQAASPPPKGVSGVPKKIYEFKIINQGKSEDA